MNLFLRKTLVLLLFLVCLDCAAQQDIPFTYFMNGNSYYNPAAAGSEEAINLTLSGKYQWTGFEKSPFLQLFSLSVPGKYQRTGYGINFVNDNMSSLRTMSVTGQFAYKIRFSRGLLAAGLYAGYKRTSYDLSRHHIKNADDPALSELNLSKSDFETGAGLYYKSEKLNAGISAMHMQDFWNQEKGNGGVHYYLTTDYRIYVKEETYLQSSIFVKYVAGLPLITKLNAIVKNPSVGWLGVGGSTSGTISFLGGLNLRSVVRAFRPDIYAGYAYDYPLTGKSTIRTSAHELYLRADIEFPERLSNIRKKRSSNSPMLF
jgi:type IX secretion system PorP/SprF family membrane protein